MFSLFNFNKISEFVFNYVKDQLTVSDLNIDSKNNLFTFNRML